MMKKRWLFLVPLITLFACSKKLVPEKPVLGESYFKLDSLPSSEFNIPIQVNLRPVYAMAEKSIDKEFNSPNWPNEWIQPDCATRYKYRFRRGPLQFRASGLSLALGFTGNYQIIGSTRACVGGTILSPWTPPCSCGFEEGERRVNVSFNNSIAFMNDYKVKLNIERMEPVPIDKCSICFWGQDITKTVMSSLKEELDLAKKAVEDSFGTVDLAPRFREIWNQLNKPINLAGLGWLQVNPQQFRLNNLYARNDSLNLFLGLSARPVIRLDKPAETSKALPMLAPFKTNTGFNIFLDAVLNYDSLSNILTTQLKDQQYEFDKGPVKKIFIVKNIQLIGQDNEKLVIRLDFEGSDKGTIYLTGKPVYDPNERIMQFAQLDFDIRTKDLLVKSAGWLFNKKILNEIQQYSRFDLGSLIDSSMITINKQLNREIMPGIKSYGKMNQLVLLGLYPFKDNLVIRSNISGDLTIKVESIGFSL